MVQGVSSGFEHRVCRHEDVTPSHHMGICGRRDIVWREERLCCVPQQPRPQKGRAPARNF